MSFFVNFIITLIILALFAFAVFIFFCLLKLRKEEDENAPILINFSSYKTNGRMLGTLIPPILKGKNGRLLIKYSPKDVDVKKPSEKEVQIITQPNKLIPISAGDWSGDRNVLLVLPHNPEDFASKLNCKELENLFTAVEQKNVSDNIIKAQREGRNRQEKLSLIEGWGELSEEHVRKKEDDFESMKESLTKERERERKYPGLER